MTAHLVRTISDTTDRGCQMQRPQCGRVWSKLTERNMVFPSAFTKIWDPFLKKSVNSFTMFGRQPRFLVRPSLTTLNKI